MSIRQSLAKEAMNFFSRWRHKRTLQQHAIPEALWQEALAALPFLAGWPKDALEALRAASALFLRDKKVMGARGFALTPFHRVVVAAQACIPVLKLGLEWYDDFKTVVLFPGEFRSHAEWEDEDGIFHRDEEPMMGEVMPGGPMVLSWADLLGEGAIEEEAAEAGNIPPLNVVIHEFVHKLDMRNGEANGCPPLPPKLPPAHWQQTMRRAYEDFCRRVEAEEDMGLDAYAAEHPSEFFAVLSETFFVAPKRLREAYPDVYECFRLLYRYETGTW
jgi:Mlc titration factor MtfA (ptsG expression regulator)